MAKDIRTRTEAGKEKSDHKKRKVLEGTTGACSMKSKDNHDISIGLSKLTDTICLSSKFLLAGNNYKFKTKFILVFHRPAPYLNWSNPNVP